MWEILAAPVFRIVRKFWGTYKMRIPFFPQRWRVEWVLLKHQRQIQGTIEEPSNVRFLRRIQHLYPILEAQGIPMPQPGPFLDSDEWQSYHRNILKELKHEVEKMEDDCIPLDVEAWSRYVTRQESYRY